MSDPNNCYSVELELLRKTWSRATVSVKLGDQVIYVDEFNYLSHTGREKFVDALIARYDKLASHKDKLLEKLTNFAAEWASAPKEETEEPRADTSRIFTVPAVEAWDEPVDLGDALEEARVAVLRHMYITEEAAIAAALWAAATHVYDRFDVFPILAIQSPTKRCGKSTLLTILERLVSKPLMAANLSAAAVFRVVELCRPTLLIDEADTWLVTNEEAKGIVNAGHTRDTAYVVRVNPDTLQPEKFSCWSPKVIAAIGRLQGTIEDRAIRLRLHRKPPAVALARLTRATKAAIADIGRRFARWGMDYGEDIDPDGEPQVPKCLNDRAADNWRPLLILADMAGGKWLEAARRAAISLSGGEDIDAAEPGIRLLASIAELLPRWPGREIVASGELLGALRSLDEWAHYGRSGRPITPHTVARLLNPFGIKVLRQKVGGRVIRGYSASALKGAIQRYVPPPGFKASPASPSPKINISAISDNYGDGDVNEVLKMNPFAFANSNLMSPIGGSIGG